MVLAALSAIVSSKAVAYHRTPEDWWGWKRGGQEPCGNRSEQAGTVPKQPGTVLEPFGAC